MNRPTELENMKDHVKSEDSLASRFENGPPAVVPQPESEDVTTDKQQNSPSERSSPEHSESESRLNESPQQQEPRKENVVAKESLADWGVVVCVFLSNFITALDLSGFAVFYPYLVEHFGATTAAVGWCFSIYGFFQSVVALFASYPIKIYGCRLPGVVGCLLTWIGFSLSYLAPNLTTLYFTYGVIAGSGSGVAMLSTNIIIHQRFTRNRNLANGIGSLGYSCGAIMGPILANHLIQSYGWRGAFFLILGAIHAQRILLCMFFRTPASLTSLSKYASETKPRSGCQLTLKYLKETFNFSILRQARYSVYSIAYFLQMFCIGGYIPHIVNRAIHVGLNRDQGVIAVALISSMSTVIRLPISFIANHPKVNSSLVFGSGMFFAFLSIAVIFINPGMIGTMTSSTLFGLHMGCTITVFSVVAVDLMGVALLPKSLAILYFIGGFAKLVSVPLIGWVFDITRDYNKAFAIIGCMAFVSASLMIVLTVVTRCHRKTIAKDNEIPPSHDGAANQSTPEG